MGWQDAWSLTQRTISYTNHTLMPEALETWPLHFFERMLPRHLQIIYRINEIFLEEVAARHPDDVDLLRRVSFIDEGGDRRVRMAHLAFVGSHAVNGVSKIHTDLMRQTVFADFDRLLPGRIVNVTNGIAPRRWLAQVNPSLSWLISSRIGDGWMQRPRQAGAAGAVGGGCRFPGALPRRQGRQQGPPGGAHPGDGRRRRRPDLAVRRPDQAHPRIQAAGPEAAARDRALQPHPAQPRCLVPGAHHHLRRQGCPRLCDGQAHHQARQRRGAHGEQRPGGRRSPEGAVPAQLRRQPGGTDCSGRGPVRADLHRRHRGFRHRQHEDGAERRA